MLLNYGLCALRFFEIWVSLLVSIEITVMSVMGVLDIIGLWLAEKTDSKRFVNLDI